MIDQKQEYQIIKAPSRVRMLNFKEVYQYRDLIFQLALRDIRVRYANTYLGWLWAFFNPIVTVLIMSLIFHKLAKVPSGPYPSIVFTFIGLLAWTFFSSSINEATNSLQQAQQLIKKVYFPRIILPLYKNFNALIEFGVNLFIVVVLIIYFKIPLSSKFIFLPLIIIAMFLAGLTLNIFTTAWVIKYRDLTHVLPQLLRIGLYITPVAFPPSIIPDQYRPLFFLNPIAGFTELYRWSLLPNYTLINEIWISFVSLVIIFIVGIYVFSNQELKMADNL